MRVPKELKNSKFPQNMYFYTPFDLPKTQFQSSHLAKIFNVIS